MEIVSVTPDNDSLMDTLLTLLEVYYYECFPDCVGYDGWLEDVKGEIVERMTRYRGRVWLIRMYGEDVGLTVFHIEENPIERFGVIDEFYVVPACRRRKIGMEVCRLIITEMDKETVNRIILSTLSQDNDRAIHFWESLGFETYRLLMELKR